ncbi:MAG TPA: DUF3616 domain-containing protein [Gemmatimonadaceae bacterium]|nr:DUF3616 domain-containing protein [Gemmatimonadaceae bacterium]
MKRIHVVGSWLFVAALAFGCSSQDSVDADGSPSAVHSGEDTGTDTGEPHAHDAASLTLDPTPGKYLETCDGSGGVAIGVNHFLDVNDENQGVRIYERGKNAGPVKQLDVSKGIGLDTSDEADLEDAARIGDRVYVIGSHGRNKDGKLEDARYRFLAMDLSGTLPDLKVAVAGSYSHLLDDLLSSDNWTTSNASVISAISKASKLSDDSNSDLAPEKNGTNIEGLAAYPSATLPGRLAIGFRNPEPGSRAIIVTLTNADAVLGGAKAHFGEAIELDLDGLGIRSMAWSKEHDAMLIIAGPHDSGGPFRLYKWSGVASEAPSLVKTLKPPSDGSAEVVIPYPGTKDVQVLFDMGDSKIGDDSCKDASSSKRFFTDAIVHVD